jgi:glutathione S-transferase
MYKIVGFPRSRAMRVIWLLEELGEPYVLDPAFPQTETVKALNPTGKVPVLIDGDEVLTESIAICAYLADKHGRFTYPAGTVERARQDSFTQFGADVLEGALWTAAKNSFIHPEEMRVPAIKNVCRLEFARGLETLEQRLGDGHYVMGETFTIADILLGSCLGWASNAKFELPDEGPVYVYFKRLKDRPAFLATMAKVAEAA